MLLLLVVVVSHTPHLSAYLFLSSFFFFFFRLWFLTQFVASQVVGFDLRSFVENVSYSGFTALTLIASRGNPDTMRVFLDACEKRGYVPFPATLKYALVESLAHLNFSMCAYLMWRIYAADITLNDKLLAFFEEQVMEESNTYRHLVMGRRLEACELSLGFIEEAS